MDCVDCYGDTIPDEPKDGFLKWYEEGDLSPIKPTEEQYKAIAKSDTPLLGVWSLGLKINFSVEEYLKKK